MTISELRDSEWAKMRNQSAGKRIRYFWDYYKWHVLIGVTVLASAINYVVSVQNEPDATVYGLLLNSYSYFNYEKVDAQTQALADSFLDQCQLTENQMQILLDTSRVYYVDGKDDTYNYDTIQLLYACTSAESLDFITGDAASMIELAYMQFFWNLEELMPEEMLQKYKGNMLYIDMAMVRQRETVVNQDLDDNIIVYPDPSKPELMEEPVPVLISVDDSTHLQNIYSQNDGSLFFAFTSKDETGYTLKLLCHLLQEG